MGDHFRAAHLRRAKLPVRNRIPGYPREVGRDEPLRRTPRFRRKPPVAGACTRRSPRPDQAGETRRLEAALDVQEERSLPVEDYPWLHAVDKFYVGHGLGPARRRPQCAKSVSQSPI